MTFCTFILSAAFQLAMAPAASSVVWQQDAAEEPHYLTIGDTAPALDVAHWLKGDEIGEFEENGIYVIEFWATWCKYCHGAFHTLSRIQETYEPYDVTVVGVSDEKLQTVFGFLADPQWNAMTSYTIATDPDLSTQKNYMEAAAIGEIPTAFLIGRDGRVEWIGHPRQLETPLRKVIDGEWDRAAFKQKFEESMTASRARYTRMRALKGAYHRKDWDALLRLFDEAIAADPDPSGMKAQRFLLMIGEMDRAREGYAYGRSLLRDFWDDARWLNVLAWYVVDHETVRDRDLPLAMKAADRAAKLSEYADARILDTLARVYFEFGELDAALSWQRQAVEHLDPEDPLAEPIKAALTRYEKAMKKREEE